MVGWRATRLEVIQVVRYPNLFDVHLMESDVCDTLLLDKHVPEKKRQFRAEAILMIGNIFRAAKRDSSQSDTDEYVFEQLLASSQQKKKRNASNPKPSGQTSTNQI
jgi:hypothetical protein